MVSPFLPHSHQPKNKRQRHRDPHNSNKGGGRGGGPRRQHPSNNGHGASSPSAGAATANHANKKFPLETRVVRAQALGPSLPPLVITYTNEQDEIAEWLTQHTGSTGVTQDFLCLGLDTETKPCFTREASLASQGPDTIQLAKADGSCLIIHLARMERLQDLQRLLQADSIADLLEHPPNPSVRLCGYVQLSLVLKSQRIAKAGVAIDDDALELHKNRLLETNCRLDLRNIDNDDNNKKQPAPKNGDGQDSDDPNNNKQGPPKSLKGLSEFYVKGMVLPKIKRLQMSNWRGHLSDAQIGYAAADAFAGAIAVATLEASTEHQHTKESLIEMVLEGELGVVALREDRERRKQERKKQKDKKKQNKKQKNGGKNQKQNLKKEYPKQAPKNSNDSADNKNKSSKKRKANPKGHAREEVSPVYAQLNAGLSSSR